jgi:hypothetical protein
MGFQHVLRVCLQGGGVLINSGTVTLSSCTITGNTAAAVRARAQIFPSPDGKIADTLALILACCDRRFGQLQGVRTAETF